MALSNHERVGKGLDALKKGLAPYVLREMKRHFGGRLEEALGRELDGSQLSRIKQEGGGDEAFLEAVDVDALLKLMRVYYQQVFFDKLGHDARSYVGEATTARNNWAHQQSFTTEGAARVLDTMRLLLKAVSAGEEAEEVGRHLHAVRREQLETEARRETRRASSEIPDAGGGLRPWREVADPHPDVAGGRYQEAEFAADLAEVYHGTADAEYQEPGEFFRRTYLTEGMVSLLAGAMQRVAGDGGDPVVRLQTVFGGGKTHSMLALYHLLSDEITPNDIPDGEKLSGAAGMSFLPRAQRAVLVGTDLDPTRPRDHGEITARTLWGEMAYQLGGAEGYAAVAEADERGVAPGADTIKRLFDERGSVLVLIDELVAYIRNIYGNDGLPSGSFDSNLTFVQNLTEAAKRSESSMVVVSIPVSERADEQDRSDAEIGGEAGRLAAERLESLIGRVESLWKPVGAAESFEIVRRRLFSGEINAPARDAVVDAFAQMYRNGRSEYPPECSAGEYERRLRASYPIHPELFDRLYQDWSTLERFQRTRGVLRLMASIIHELWSRGDGSLMIMPGSIPLDSPKVSNQFLRYLPEGWNAVVDTDVDGPGSRPEELDGELRNLGRLAAARRVARTVFVGSAPSVAAQQVRGLQEVRVRLGCVQPGESSAVFMDALRRLTDRLAYLYTEGGRYWYDTRPNINREAADRAQQQREEDVEAEVLRRLKSEKGHGELAGVHVAPAASHDVPDEPAARLVALPPGETYRRADHEDSDAVRWARGMLDNRGSSPRRYRNALVFLASDRERALEEAARWYLAWRSIIDEEEQLNLDSHGKRQAQSNLDRADETLGERMKESYRWLLYPQQEGTGPLEWVATGLGSGGEGIIQRASRRLVNEEAVIPRWSPALLKRELEKYLWGDGEHVGLRKVRDDLCTYPYFPRLRDEKVLVEVVQEGVRSRDFFGYAHSVSDEGRYEGLQFGGLSAVIHTDPGSVLVRPEAAARQQEEERRREAEREKDEYGGESGGGGEGGVGEGGDRSTGSGTGVEPPPPQKTSRRFRGTVRLDPSRTGGGAGEISEEVIRHLVSIFGSDVEVRLEIDAEVPDGVDERTRRTVEENCRTLGFEDFGFGE